MKLFKSKFFRLNALYFSLFAITIVLLSIIFISTINKKIEEKNNFIFLNSLKNFEKEVFLTYQFQRKSGDSIWFTSNVYKKLKPFFASNPIFNNGYGFIFDVNGKLLIHPLREDDFVWNYDWAEKVFTSNYKFGKITFISKQDNRKQILYYKYFAPYKIYIAAIATAQDINS
ncbi:MAG: hypothetical protein SNJ71_07125, partial [Bacteroidales bacterium]